MLHDMTKGQRTQAPELTIRRPDAQVWQQALLLADGDPHRIEVHDDGSVIVRNRPRRFSRADDRRRR